MAIELKDTKGKSLLKKLCMPRKPTKALPYKRLTPKTSPVEFGDLYAYNIQDIMSESSVSAILPDLSPTELEIWQLDQEINARGVQIDTKGLNDCLIVIRKLTKKLTLELKDITNSPAITIDSLKQIMEWMATRGVSATSLDKDHVIELLKLPYLPVDVKKVLEIRQVLGSASVKKLYALERYVCSDGRIRGVYVYAGARQTARFAGKGPQPQNIPGGGPPVYECPSCNRFHWTGLTVCPHCNTTVLDGAEASDWSYAAAQEALTDISTLDLDYIGARWGNVIKAISGCLRALFIAAPGKELICSDYTAIEAVVLAALAGEEWRLEVFRTHGKIYETSAAKISGVPFQEFMDFKKRTGMHHPLRKKIGKVAELASGYAGWINAWKNFGADKFMNDEEIKAAILAWREESPKIVEFWGGQWRKNPHRWEFTKELYGIEGCAVMAVMNPGHNYTFQGITYGVHNKVLYCKLPSGRHLQYHNPRLIEGMAPHGHPIWEIVFDGWNSDSTKGRIGWCVRKTYGGRLTENIVQAVARDIFAQGGMLNMHKAGYPIVLHTHDEITAEVPHGWGSIAQVESLMCTPAFWWRLWPIRAAGGWRGKRYRKD